MSKGSRTTALHFLRNASPVLFKSTVKIVRQGAVSNYNTENEECQTPMDDFLVPIIVTALTVLMRLAIAWPLFLRR